MSLKISMLANDLKSFNQDCDVLVDGKNIVSITSLSNGNIHLSTQRKFAECNECGCAVYTLKNYHGGEYCGYCPNCDCNKTEFQITKIKIGK